MINSLYCDGCHQVPTLVKKQNFCWTTLIENIDCKLLLYKGDIYSQHARHYSCIPLQRAAVISEAVRSTWLYRLPFHELFVNGESAMLSCPEQFLIFNLSWLKKKLGGWFAFAVLFLGVVFVLVSLSISLCILMLIDADWGWLVQIDPDWFWNWLILMLINAVGAVWCWLMLIDADWFLGILIGANWQRLMLIGIYLFW